MATTSRIASAALRVRRDAGIFQLGVGIFSVGSWEFGVRIGNEGNSPGLGQRILAQENALGTLCIPLGIRLSVENTRFHKNLCIPNGMLFISLPPIRVSGHDLLLLFLVDFSNHQHNRVTG